MQSCILLPSEGYTRKQKKYKKKVDWALYSDEVTKLSQSAVGGGLVHLENQLVDTASGCDAKALPADTKIWDCQELRDLREKRRLCTNVEERSKITKTIWKVTRQQLRRYRTKQIQARLESFSELQHLEHIRVYPIKKQSIMKADDKKCATSLENVYSADTPYSYSSACNVPPFTIEELNYVAKKMKKGKSTDTIRLVSEMFIHASADVLENLLFYLNEVLRTGEIPPNWFNTHFTLLHKGGDVHDVQNWRPTANLNITYRILARLVFNRISRALDSHQSEDQFGFRRNGSCAHALYVLESMISKGIEFNVPVWIISIDLKKVFDRIEHHALFRALREQEMDPEIIALLERLYSDQHGTVGNYRFRISRGVRQGDVLNPILFNAVLEHATRK